MKRKIVPLSLCLLLLLSACYKPSDHVSVVSDTIQSQTTGMSESENTTDPPITTCSSEVESSAETATTRQQGNTTKQSSTRSITKSTTSATKATSDPVKEMLMRAQDYNVGSCVYDGYVYYSPSYIYSALEGGIYKKKLNSNEPESKVSSTEGVRKILIINPYMYILNSQVYRCDMNGNNKVLLDSQHYIDFWVAGKWVFAQTNEGRLFMFRSDGSGSRKTLSPGTKYDYSSASKIISFNRGYCYYMAEDSWRDRYENGSIIVKSKSVNSRIDYTSTNPAISTADLTGYEAGVSGFDFKFEETYSGALITDMLTNKTISLDNQIDRKYRLLGVSKDCLFYDSYENDRITSVMCYNARTGKKTVHSFSEQEYSIYFFGVDYMSNTLQYTVISNLVMPATVNYYSFSENGNEPIFQKKSGR